MFEEVVTRELNSLYQGALFLCAGSRETAEELLERCLSEAFAAYPRDGLDEEEARRWLEGRLACAHVQRRPAGEPGGAAASCRPMDPPPSSADLESLAPDALFHGARVVPAHARLAIWLVHFCRWSYQDAADVLQVERGVLRRLLTYRHALIRAVLGAPAGGRFPRESGR
ncbi:MAG: hypothetical protein KY453_07820 [Gemmatimonadetes bacterium]|nr:hypothetical protein [Gemmatimonadota bacterium]